MGTKFITGDNIFIAGMLWINPLEDSLGGTWILNTFCGMLINFRI